MNKPHSAEEIINNGTDMLIRKLTPIVLGQKVLQVYINEVHDYENSIATLFGFSLLFFQSVVFRKENVEYFYCIDISRNLS